MSFYPLQTDISKAYESKLVQNNFKNSIQGLNNGIIARDFNKNILNKTNKFKIHEQLKDIKEHNKDTGNMMISSLSGEKIPVE